MKKIKLLILPVLFFGFIYFMFFNQIFAWKVYKSDAENRSMAEFPELDIYHLDDYPENFNAYIDDNYSFRALYVEFYHDLMFQLGVSPDQEKVLVGTNYNTPQF